MMTYGDPPDPAECRDVGVLDVPRAIHIDAGLEADGAFGHLIELSGTPLPRIALIREAHARLKIRPAKVVVPGLGTLYTGSTGWLLEEE